MTDEPGGGTDAGRNWERSRAGRRNRRQGETGAGADPRREGIRTPENGPERNRTR